MSGCPLKCAWCHNPESQAVQPSLLYCADKCVSCMRCVSLCPNGCHFENEGKHGYARGVCTACGKCVSPLCEALELSSSETSADGVMNEVLKDLAYYEHSGGGITLSGGEPTYQAEFCTELAEKAKKNGLHVCIETCGFVSSEVLARAAEYTDIFLFDFKETDPERHREYTGVDNRVILENLALLNAWEKDIILRCPIIPGLNLREEHILGIAEIANRFEHIKTVELEPYHTLGVKKYSRLGRTYSVSDVPEASAEDIKKCMELLEKHTSVRIKRA